MSAVSRRFALLLLVVLAVPAIALAADTDPKRKINGADERKAASIVFKRTDFSSGWNRTSTPNSDDDDLNCSFYHPDGSDLTLTGDAEAEFQRTGGFPSVLSYADVYATAKDASSAWSRTVKPALARCLAQFFQREVAGPGTKITVVNHGKIAFPRLAPRTAAFRIVVRMVVTQNGHDDDGAADAAHRGGGAGARRGRLPQLRAVAGHRRDRPTRVRHAPRGANEGRGLLKPGC